MSMPVPVVVLVVLTAIFLAVAHRRGYVHHARGIGGGPAKDNVEPSLSVRADACPLSTPFEATLCPVRLLLCVMIQTLTARAALDGPQYPMFSPPDFLFLTRKKNPEKTHCFLLFSPPPTARTQMVNFWKPTLSFGQVDFTAIFQRNHIPSTFAGHITFQS